MSEIEASVTKLLIATKQLLECLTQWSRSEASENDVSDIYVNLGNEFNRATVSFQNAGIDMSDLENTPNDLRNILERALGEEASVINLDKFLPRIREIIINLLQGLKRKQQIHRIQNGEAAAPSRMRRSESQGTQQPSGARNMDMSRQRSASPSITSVATSSPQTSQNGHSSMSYSPAKRQLPVVPGQITSPSQILPPRKAPEPPVVSRELFSPAPPIIANSDPVTQLSQITLERRSSKRFSENYLAQLTSSPNSDRSGKLSVDVVRKHLQRSISIPETIEDDGVESVEYSASRAYGSPPQIKMSSSQAATNGPIPPAPVFKSIESPKIRSPVLNGGPTFPHDIPKNEIASSELSDRQSKDICLFVKHMEETKKLVIKAPVTFENLRSTIKSTYDTASIEVLYIEDRTTKINYELEELSDVTTGSLITVRSSSNGADEKQPSTLRNHEQDLKSWLDQRLQELSSELMEIKKTSAMRVPSDATKQVTTDETTSATTPMKVITEASATTSAVVAENSTLKIEVERLKAELDEAQTALKNASTEPPAIVVSVNRDHVMSMSAKHEHRGTELTAKLEEAMNTMERIRKDVLQRKVTPRPQQLADLSTQFDEIAKESEALAQNLVLLDAASNKLWEEELTIITSEQDSLEYQRAFIDDIKADLEQSLSSLTTIKQVEEQKRFAPVSSVPMIVETSTDPSRAIKFVQADIKSLQVNHERRAAAIADAEKQRLKEREYLMENEFKNELGSFVASNTLKNTGGAAEIERIRAEKDNAHRKMIYSTPNTPNEELPADDVSTEMPMKATADSEMKSTVELAKSETTQKTPDQIKAAVSSASILAKIDASKSGDALERRRSSAMLKHVPSNESLSARERVTEGHGPIREEEVATSATIDKPQTTGDKSREDAE